MRGARLSLVLVAVVACLAVPGVAAAAGPRYASMFGSGSACSSDVPCSLNMALTGGSAGDEVIVTPGFYPNLPANGTPADGLTVHGVAGEPPPVLEYADTGLFLLGQNAPTHLRHLEIETPASSGYGIAIHGTTGTTVDDVVVNSGGSHGCIFGGALTVTNTVCAAPDGTALDAAGMAYFAGTNATLIGVTAVGETGIRADAGDSAITLAIHSSIARGSSGTDIGTSKTGSGSSTVDVDHSNYAAAMPGAGTTITDHGGQITEAPLFVDATNGNFHQTAGSPTVDKGVRDFDAGTSDIDGDPRSVGFAPDIGADEYVRPDVTTGPPRDIGTHGAILTGRVNPHGQIGTAHFEYGTLEGASTQATAVQPGSEPQQVSASATGLASNFTFRYHLEFEAAGTTTYGDDGVFTTKADGAGGFFAPVLGGLAISPRKFAVEPKKLVPLDAARARKGATIKYSLSQAAEVTLRIDRARPGRREGTNCMKATKGPGCTRFAKVTTLSRDSKAGVNKVAFSGRIGTKRLSTRLARGRYRLTATAIGVFGNRSLPERVMFRIVKR